MLSHTRCSAMAKRRQKLIKQSHVKYLRATTVLIETQNVLVWFVDTYLCL